MPTPRRSPVERASTSRAAGSPSWASSVTSAPVISRPESSARPSAESGAPARDPHALAPDRDARRRAPPGSRRSGSCPGTAARRRRRRCGRARPPPPRAPRTSRPSTTRPPPIPVPIVSMTAFAAPRAAPKRHSASIAAFASLSTTTGSAERARPAGRGTRRRRAAGGCSRSATPVAGSTRHGIPKPTASTSLGDRLARPPRPRRRSCRERRVGVLATGQPVGAVVDLEARVDRAGEQLRPAQVDADHAAAGHARPPYPADGATREPEAPPEYRRYRTRPRLLSRGRRRRESLLDELRGRARAAGAPAAAGSRSAGRRRGSWLAVVGWIVLVARPLPRQLAQVHQDRRRQRDARRRSPRRPGPAARHDDARPGLRPAHEGHEGARREHVGPEPLRLDPAPAHRRRRTRPSSRSRATRSSTSPATGATRSTRPTRSAARRSRSARSSSSSGSRSTTSSLSTSTTFPTLIDAHGRHRRTRRLRRLAHQRRLGATAATRCGCAPARTTSTAAQALALARTRKNHCNPSENDLTRARRQQKIVAAMKSRVLSPVRLRARCRSSRGTPRTRSAEPT